MNWKNANIKVCRALANHERICGYRMGVNNFLVTVDGCYAYIFPMKQIHFNKDEVRIISEPLIKNLNDYLDGIDIQPTDLCLDTHSSLIRRFKGPNHALWIKEEYLRHFEGTRYCQDRTVDHDKLPISPVLILEADHPVGLVLPVRVFDGRTLKEVAECDECGIYPANG